MKFKFLVKPPLKRKVKKGILDLKRKFEVEVEIAEKEGEKSFANLAKVAIRKGFDNLIVVGGDGSINEVVNGLFQEKSDLRDLILGVIPTGSGNNFAKALNISTIKRGFEAIKKQKPILVDLGKVNSKYFVNCFSVGLDAQINDLANKLKDKMKILPKSLSYFFAALQYITFKFKCFSISIETENLKKSGKMVLAAVTNSESYGGFFRINPGAKISDGFLNLCYIEPLGKIKALVSLFKVIKGTHVFLKEVKMQKIKSLKIKTEKPLIWEIDGEVQKPKNFFKIEILPKALKFFSNL